MKRHNAKETVSTNLCNRYRHTKTYLDRALDQFRVIAALQGVRQLRRQYFEDKAKQILDSFQSAIAF